MRVFTAAVIGAGFIGPVHVEGLRRAGVRVAGVLGSTPDKSRAAAAALGLPRGYASLDELLADPEVDAAHVAAPNREHFSLAAAALRAGKHVLCEKPLGMNSTETAELTRLARASGRAAGVAYNIRFYPLCHEAAARARSGELGELLHVVGAYTQDWLLYDTDFNWRVLAEQGGALRAVADIGTHWLDLIQFITGRRVAAVCADLRTVHAARRRPAGAAETFSRQSESPDAAGVDAGDADAGDGRVSTPISTEDCGCVMLRFDNGANGCLWVSQTTAGRKNQLRFELGGARRALAWNSETPNELWIGRRDGPNETLPRDPALLSPAARAIASYPGGHNEGFADTFKQLFRAFYGYIAAGDFEAPPPFPTFEDGHREALLCEAVLRSHQHGGWATVAADGPGAVS